MARSYVFNSPIVWAEEVASLCFLLAGHAGLRHRPLRARRTYGSVDRRRGRFPPRSRSQSAFSQGTSSGLPFLAAVDQRPLLSLRSGKDLIVTTPVLPTGISESWRLAAISSPSVPR